MPLSPRRAPPPRSTAAPSVTPPVLLPPKSVMPRPAGANPPRSAPTKRGGVRPSAVLFPAPPRTRPCADTSAAALVPQRCAGRPRRPSPPPHRGPPPHSRRRPSFPPPPTIPIRRPASHRAQCHSIRRAVPTRARNTNRFRHLREVGARGRTRRWTAAGKNYARGAGRPVEAATNPLRRARQVGATAGAGPGPAARASPAEA